jgi:hypothetical protein
VDVQMDGSGAHRAIMAIDPDGTGAARATIPQAARIPVA